LLWIIPIFIYFLLFIPHTPVMLLFIPITFICHTATDYYTSRANMILWEKKNVHGFFVSVGFDQFLHYVQLLLTFYLLS
jgi:hypothetical protein